MRIDLDGKRVLVTGGNSGLGAAVVRAFGEAGARVAINYVVAPTEAEALADELARGGNAAMAIDADISAPEAVAGMAVVLASDVASYVTATTVFVDGGMTDYPDFMHGG